MSSLSISTFLSATFLIRLKHFASKRCCWSALQTLRYEVLTLGPGMMLINGLFESFCAFSELVNILFPELDLHRRLRDIA